MCSCIKDYVYPALLFFFTPLIRFVFWNDLKEKKVLLLNSLDAFTYRETTIFLSTNNSLDKKYITKNNNKRPVYSSLEGIKKMKEKSNFLSFLRTYTLLSSLSLERYTYEQISKRWERERIYANPINDFSWYNNILYLG